MCFEASTGNDMNTYADDLAAVIDALDLTAVALVGHSTGGGEVARYIGRHGIARVAGAVLIAAVPPLLLKNPRQPGRPPDRGIRQPARPSRRGSRAVLPGPCRHVLRGESAGRGGSPGPPRAVLELVQASLKNAEDVYYPGVPHGITATHQDEVNAELLAFLRGLVLRGPCRRRGTGPNQWRCQMAELTPPPEGIVLAHFIVSDDVERSRRFYTEVLGGRVVFFGEPTYVALSNSWIIINVGGGPTDDKPGVTLATPSDPDRVSSFLNIRVKDIEAVYAEWSARGAQFLTPPKRHQHEIRCYIRDPDGHLIEVGQTTDSAGDWSPARWPSSMPAEELRVMPRSAATSPSTVRSPGQ